MPAPTTPLLTRWETSLDVLRTHSALGPIVRFYFRRREQRDDMNSSTFDPTSMSGD